MDPIHLDWIQSNPGLACQLQLPRINFTQLPYQQEAQTPMLGPEQATLERRGPWRYPRRLLLSTHTHHHPPVTTTTTTTTLLFRISREQKPSNMKPRHRHQFPGSGEFPELVGPHHCQVVLAEIKSLNCAFSGQAMIGRKMTTVALGSGTGAGDPACRKAPGQSGVGVAVIGSTTPKPDL